VATESTPRSDNLLDECRLMLAFARELGLTLPPDLAHDISTLDRLLVGATLPPISELPTGLVDGDVAVVPPPTSDANSPSRTPLSPTELALRVHGALSKAISPATPLTLEATQPTDGRRGVFARMPRIVKVAAVWSILSALLYIVSAAQVAATAIHDGAHSASDMATPDASAHDDGPGPDKKGP
jgi:hypothetical protein